MSPARKRRRVTSADMRTQDEEHLSPSQRFQAFKKEQVIQTSLRAQWVATLPFELDQFQIDAMDSIEARHSVLVAAPTGAGKTLVGEFAVYLAQQDGTRAFYTTPIKALSNQKFQELTNTYGAERVGLLTGDTSINPEAPIVVMTTEVLRNMVYADAPLDDLAFVILDEVHYLADRMRGPVWEEVILHLPAHVKIVSLSATVSNAEEFGAWIREVRGSCDIIVWERRPVPLFQHMMVGPTLYDLYSPSRKGEGQSKRINPRLSSVTSTVGRRRYGADRPQMESRPGTILELQRQSLLPAIFFVFSRQGCEDAVAQCRAAGIHLTTRSQADQIEAYVSEVIARIDPSDHAALGVDRWVQSLKSGIAAHHAGMLPLMKETVENLFARGLLRVVFATETLALGINMPARTVVIESLQKWNGIAHVQLSPGEFTQLTGRAGRRGKDSEGHGVVLHRGKVAPEEVASLVSKRTYPLISAFKPTYNMVVNLLIHSTRAKTAEILESSFAQYQADSSVVHLVRQAKEAKRRVAQFEAELHCDAGDAAEYFMLREEIARLQKEGAKQRGIDERHDRMRAMKRAKRGSIIALRKGRRDLYSVVTDVVYAANGSIALKAIGTDAKFHHHGSSDAAAFQGVVGSMNLPSHSQLRRHAVRMNVAKELLGLIRSGSLVSVSRSNQDSRSPAWADTTELERQLKRHPVHRCPERETHSHAGHAWVRAKRELTRLNESVAHRTSSVAQEFKRVCQVLERMKFIEGDNVTDQGLALRHIFGERDLLITHAVHSGVFDNLDAAQLAGLLSTVVYETRSDSSGRPTLPRGTEARCADAWDDLAAAYNTVMATETACGKQPSPPPDPGILTATVAWIRGASLTTALGECDLQGGDFVRWMRQVMDVLDQVRRIAPPALARTCRQAREAIDHGMVAWSAL